MSKNAKGLHTITKCITAGNNLDMRKKGYYRLYQSFLIKLLFLFCYYPIRFSIFFVIVTVHISQTLADK